MTLPDVVTKARALTHTDSVSYTDANALIDANIWLEKIESMILESADEEDFDDSRATDYPIVTTALTTNRDYTIPVANKVLKIKRVDVTYDGSHWFKAEPFDDGTFPYGFGSDTEIDSNFIKEAPKYDIKYNSIFLYPLAASTDVSAGGKIRIEWNRLVTPFVLANLSDTTVIPGFDDPFHPMLSWGMAYEKASSELLPQLEGITKNLADWETRLREHYSRRNLDRQLMLSTNSQPYNTYR